MSVLKFTLKEEHIALLRAMNWSRQEDLIVSIENIKEDKSPFGGDDINEDMNIILYGKPKDFNPSFSDELPQISKEKKEEFDKLLSELPMALEVILRTQSFEIGDYRARYHQRFSWKKKQLNEI